MDAALKYMDDFSALLETMAHWIAREPRSRLIFAAFSRVRSQNVPYPLIGILYQAEGEYAWWERGGKRFTIPHNHICAGFSHQGACSSEPPPGAGFWSCAFNAADVTDFDVFVNAPTLPTIPVRDPLRLNRAYQDVATQFLMRRPTSGLRLKAALLNWIATLLDEVHGQGSDGDAMVPPPVEKALKYMHPRLGDAAMTLDTVAQAAGLSVQHFGRLFAETMGLPPMAYLRQMRIRHARHLLQETQLRVSEIASEAGFADPLHFSRVFHRMTGQSPRAFRLAAPGRRQASLPSR